jgi:Arc/MetJ-type ribon-helix-helix transcriptional regulator
MNIPLKKHQADWIAEQVSSGRYQTELEAIEDAIAAMMREDDADWKATREKLLERIRTAQEDIRNGRTILADDAFFESKRQMIRDQYMTPKK